MSGDSVVLEFLFASTLLHDLLSRVFEISWPAISFFASNLLYELFFLMWSQDFLVIPRQRFYCCFLILSRTCFLVCNLLYDLVSKHVVSGMAVLVIRDSVHQQLIYIFSVNRRAKEFLFLTIFSEL